MPNVPRKSPPKEAKVTGKKIEMTERTSIKDLVESVPARTAQAELRTKAQQTEGLTKPDLTPRPCLVAFIDILGFGHELQRASTKGDLERLYEKVRLVQMEFQKESAVDDPEGQATMNADYGRRVIALSDAVVVVITSNCAAAPLMGPYDHLGFAIYELILAQARCVAAHGIFVRGGVSHGSFYFENDILLSPALARAYELESKYAEYPLIVVPEETRQEILNTPKMGFYAPGADPTLQYFARHGKRSWRGAPIYYLDYMSVMINEQHRGMLKEDRKEYLKACEEHDDERAQAIMDRSALKDAAYFLNGHRKKIEDAYTATIVEKVRKKYRWLMKYHNRSFRNKMEYIRDEVIDLTKFQPSSKK